MNTYKYIIACLMLAISLASCDNLDVKPMDLVQDEDLFTSESGVDSYLARMYGQMPVEDFKYTPARGFNNFWTVAPFSTITGEALCHNQNGAETEVDAALSFFSDAYYLMRDINYFINAMPPMARAAGQTDADINKWLGEAYAIRGYTYFALAKRYGGVPIVNKVLNYPDQSIESLQVPRASEQATWEQAAADLDSAYVLLPETNQRGRHNKYTAAGFKSRVMLYAGCIAKYNTTNLTDKDGNRLCGIPAEKAPEYFKAAYDAAKLLESHYSLYKEDWKADNKEAQYQNFVDLYFDKNSTENIFVRDYLYPSSVHGYDVYFIPFQYQVAGYAGYCNPTLDFVELFDGLPKDADGHIKVTDEKGNYVLYDKEMDLFANAEPRLRATVIFPGDLFKGTAVEIWRGIYTGPVEGGIKRLMAADDRTGYEVSSVKDLLVTSANEIQTPYTLSNGQKMNPAGRSGTFYNNRAAALTGFTIRKYLNPDMPASEVREGMSDQSWIELRYAEILLNRAEAAYELSQAGQSGTDYVGDAYQCINQIRERAGATLLKSAADLHSIDTIRIERKKELAFENQAWWDMRRWRTMDEEQNSRSYRILNPFYADKAGKWFFNDRYDERNGYWTFDTRWYYAQILPKYINNNPTLVQNPGY